MPCRPIKSLAPLRCERGYHRRTYTRVRSPPHLNPGPGTPEGNWLDGLTRVIQEYRCEGFSSPRGSRRAQSLLPAASPGKPYRSSLTDLSFRRCGGGERCQRRSNQHMECPFP